MDKRSEPILTATRRRFLRLGAGCVVAAAACQPIARPAPGPAPAPGWIARLYADAGARVWRDGRGIAYAHGMNLRAGDEIETGEDNVALIEFSNGDDVYMRPMTRVRVGSIFVFFGEIFNRVVSGRGFRADSEAMEAGVEETEFLMRVDRVLQEATVVVRRGAVRCRPRRGAWAPQRVGEGQRLTAQRGSGLPPRQIEMSPAEVAAAMAWADEATRRLKLRPPPDGRAPYVPSPERRPAYPQPGPASAPVGR